jgi:molecular chaperone HtpG
MIIDHPTNNIEPVIGKDVIESLTLGMYEDCRFIYREYIQNSADQIDKAVREGLLNKIDEEVHIFIDNKKRSIEFYDNATGIISEKVSPILRNIAQSTKEKGVDKGFRGIGRLGGLGYCKKLTFETSAMGEAVKSTMIWDASLLKQIINNRKNKDNATEVIKKVTQLTVEEEDPNLHYFRVTMEDVTNDNLLEIDSVKKYLSMVLPIDYLNTFYYKSKIDDYIKNINVQVDSYKIFVNDELISKPYTADIYADCNGGKQVVDEILDLNFISQYANDGQLLYWGWYSISKLVGQMKPINTARGIRLRKSNIQIGSSDSLGRFFPKEEDRWTLYFFGEIHAVHQDLIPNARRDYFGEDPICTEFEEKLKIDLIEPYKMCYDVSKLRSNTKTIQSALDLGKAIHQKETKDGFKSEEERKSLYENFEDRKKKAEKSKEEIAKIKTRIDKEESPIKKIFHHVASNKDIEIKDIDESLNDGKTKFITDGEKYSSIPKKDRKLISKIYSIIGNALPKDLANTLIKKIEEDLTK